MPIIFSCSTCDTPWPVIALKSRLEIDLAEVRAVNKCVTHGARLIFLRLVMRGTNGRLRWHTAHRQRVALQAELVDLADLQQPRVGGSVRNVARGASLGPYREMLENKGALLFAMALVADLVLLSAGAQLPGQRAAVRVMTVGTLNEALLYAMTVGAIEFGADLGVTPIT